MKTQNSKTLRTLLLDFQRNAMEGGFTDSSAVGNYIKTQTENDPDAPPVAKLLCALGNPDQVLAVSRYWQFRDEVKEFQLANNISAVLWEDRTWLGDKITYPQFFDQLELMPQDRRLLRRWKTRTINKYLDFLSRHNLPLNLDQTDDDDCSELIPVSPAELIAHSADYDYAWLAGSEDSRLINEKGELIGHFSEYTLFLDDFPKPDGADGKCLTFSACIERPL